MKRGGDREDGQCQNAVYQEVLVAVNLSTLEIFSHQLHLASRDGNTGTADCNLSYLSAVLDAVREGCVPLLTGTVDLNELLVTVSSDC